MAVRPKSILRLVILLFVTLLLYFYLRPVTFLLNEKRDARNKPELWVVPVPIDVVTSKSPVARTFSYFGYDFDSPWADVKSERNTALITALTFSGERGISFWNPEKIQDGLGILRAPGGRASPFEGMFGEEAMRSDFAFRSKVLNQTPADLRWRFSPQAMVGESLLLMFKGIDARKGVERVYSFETSNFRGFQSGDPNRDDTIIIDAFDAQGRTIRTFVGQKRGKGGMVSQSDINLILTSIRPHPASPAK
jgi:hypothetical protein